MSIVNPTLAHFSQFRHFSSLYFPLHLSRILYKSSLFMQNKPNLLEAQMNVNSLITIDYENISDWTLGQNKPNQSQLNPISSKAQNERKRFFTKGL